MEFIPRFGSINKHTEMHSLKIMEFNILTAPSGEKNAKRSPRVKMLARKQMISVWMSGTMFARVHILGSPVLHMLAPMYTIWPWEKGELNPKISVEKIEHSAVHQAEPREDN